LGATDRSAAHPAAACDAASRADVSRAGRRLRGQFTYPAALGDFLAALLALVAIPAVAARARVAKPLVWLFNIEGTLDLIAATVLATVYDAPPLMGPAYWIPALWVPALLVTHYITFLLLTRSWPGPKSEG
jgi:hypothetical protein